MTDTAPVPVTISAADILENIRLGLPHGGEKRPSQVALAMKIEQAVREDRILFGKGPTGTGKSLANLAGVIAAREAVKAGLPEGAVVPPIGYSAPSKSLQRQLASEDLPLIAAQIPGFNFVVLMGRSNYVCDQRVEDLSDPAERLQMELAGDAPDYGEVDALMTWLEEGGSGNLTEVPVELTISPKTRKAVTITSDECNGKNCPMYKAGRCTYEQVKAAAAKADVVVYNTTIEAIALLQGIPVIPELFAKVIDECQELPDIVAKMAGDQLNPRGLAEVAKQYLNFVDEDRSAARLEVASQRLDDLLEGFWRDLMDKKVASPRFKGGLALAADPDFGSGAKVDRYRKDLYETLVSIQDALRLMGATLGTLPVENEAAKQKRDRLRKAIASRQDAVLAFMRPEKPGGTTYVEKEGRRITLVSANVNVSAVIRAWLVRTPTVLTSATIPTNLPGRCGAQDAEVFSVESPFDYSHSRLYVAASLPEPNDPRFAAAQLAEAGVLLSAAAGRAVVLCTSNKAIARFVEMCKERFPNRPVFYPKVWSEPSLEDGLAPKDAVDAVKAAPDGILVGSRQFMTGMDIRYLDLVIIDRLSFPTPDDPIVQAMRELVESTGGKAFFTVDVPLAAATFGQAAGRSIRGKAARPDPEAGDQYAVVALLDPRIGPSGKSYRREMLGMCPPFPQVYDLDAAVSVLLNKANGVRVEWNTSPAGVPLAGMPAAEPGQVDQTPVPRVSNRPPEGRYAVDLRGELWFAQLKHGRVPTVCFIDRVSGDNLLRIDRATQGELLAEISKDPAGAMARYGREVGRCAAMTSAGSPCLRSLTDEASRARGVGPDCAERLGIA